MPSMRLSVAIAACQDPTGLVRAVESVLAQDRPVDQVIVTEDKNASALADRFGGQIETVYIDAGLTLAQQWNQMASALDGDWVSFLGSGDCARPNFTTEIERTIALSANAAIVRAGWVKLRENTRLNERFTLNSVRSVVGSADALYEQRFGPKGSFSAAAIRREVWEQAGRFPEETPHLGDWAMWLLAASLGETVRSREIIAEHTVRASESTTEARRTVAEIQETFRIYEVIFPRATLQAGLGSPSWIGAASRKRFRDIALSAANDLPPAQRGTVINALRPWAETVDQRPLLQRLEQGERVRDYNLARRLKPAFNRVMSAVR